jgi:hypothetical protein
MSHDNDELFTLAVKLTRAGASYPEIISELEAVSQTPEDVRGIIAKAGAYVAEVQKESLECAVVAFKQGRSFFDVCKTLEKCGFHSYDASVVAGRAKHAADAELAAEAKESLENGLSALGKSDGHQS